MARMIAEPRTFTAGRTPATRTAPVARPKVTPTTPPPVLGDRVAGARPQTRVARHPNRAVRQQMLVVLAASFLVFLAFLYVSAYARVTAEGFEVASLNRKIQAAEARKQALKAAIAECSSLESVARYAQSMGLVPSQPDAVNMVDSAVQPAPAQPPTKPVTEATP